MTLLSKGASLPITAVLAAAAMFGAGQPISVDAAASSVNWERQAPVQSPSARTFAAASYDSNRDRVVLFGGSTSAANLGDTWEWDGTAWTQQLPATSPPALAGAAMAYDAALGRSVLFGGSASTGTSSDTWEWDGIAWTKVNLSATPPPMVWASMVYDGARARLVLFGAYNSFGLWLSETWEFDGSTWTQLHPANSPSARTGAAMAFDSSRNRAVLFGGRDSNSGARSAETWEWDGTNWTLRATVLAPYERFWQSMAFDPVRSRTILFGGDHFQPYKLGETNDTWEWDGSQWTRDWTAAAPSVRAGQSMVYDSATGRMVLFGGFDAGVSPNTYANDTWELGAGIVTPPGSPAVSISPTSGEFGSVDLGSSSLAGAFNIVSSGTGPLVTALTATGDFAVSSTDCPDSQNPLAAGSSCLAFVTFSPTVPGDRVGSLLLTGNIAGGTLTIPLHGIGLESDFTISTNPTSINMVVGSPNPTSSVTTTAIGAAGTIKLSALTTDPGVTATFSPDTITAGSGSTMTIVLAPSVTPGFYGIRVVGTQGTLTHYVDVSLHVSAIPDFSITVTPTAVADAQGASVSSAVTTSAVGTVGAVNLSAVVTPGGPTAVLSPSTVAAGGVATLTVSAGYGVPPGTYTVTVTGTEGSISHAANVLVTVTVKAIVNGGFETGDLTGWDQSGTTAAVRSPHTGTFAGEIGSGSAFASVNSTLAQTFTVPASGGKLTFWYKTLCTDKVKNDWFTATLQDGATGTVSVLQAPVCPKAGGWTKVTANLSAHSGHFVTVTFLNHDDGVALTPTFTTVDDVTLT